MTFLNAAKLLFYKQSTIIFVTPYLAHKKLWKKGKGQNMTDSEKFTVIWNTEVAYQYNLMINNMLMMNIIPLAFITKSF